MIDWHDLIRQLEGKRLRHIDIAAYVFRSERWVGMLKAGLIKDPPHTQGVMLLEMARVYAITPRETQDRSVQAIDNA